MHGQSDYTPLKQAQLKSLLEACTPAWLKSHWFSSDERIFIDCMAGSGRDDKGNAGSPLILQEHAKQFNAGFCVWCDISPKHTEQLEAYRNDTITTLLTGRYQSEVMGYMSIVSRKAMGLIYLDDNGCKQIWNDDGFLRHVMTNYPLIDVALHFSEQAWMRSDGAGIDWAERTTAMDILKLMLHYKPESVVYAPHIKHHWRLVYGCGSSKMDLRGQQRIKLRDYIDMRLENQLPLLEGVE